MSKDEKSRTSITLSESALTTAKERYRELGYSSLSEMLEALILQDAAERREHILVRSPDGVHYSTKGKDTAAIREKLKKMGEPSGDK